jgi:hypothetical protein
MPIILEKLLKERKDTRKKILYKTVIFKDEPNVGYSGLYKESKDKTTFSLFNIDKNDNELEDEPISDILSIKDTYNDF